MAKQKTIVELTKSRVYSCDSPAEARLIRAAYEGDIDSMLTKEVAARYKISPSIVIKTLLTLTKESEEGFKVRQNGHLVAGETDIPSQRGRGVDNGSLFSYHWFIT